MHKWMSDVDQLLSLPNAKPLLLINKWKFSKDVIEFYAQIRRWRRRPRQKQHRERHKKKESQFDSFSITSKLSCLKIQQHIRNEKKKKCTALQQINNYRLQATTTTTTQRFGHVNTMKLNKKLDRRFCAADAPYKLNKDIKTPSSSLSTTWPLPKATITTKTTKTHSKNAIHTNTQIEN